MNGDAAEKLKKSLKEPACMAFSGGLDSSFLAFLSKGMDIGGIVVGFRGSHDIMWAPQAAALIDFPIKTIILSENEVISAARTVSRILDTEDLIVISFELPLFFVAESAEYDYIITGQGADEIFGGYKRYENMNKDDLSKEMAKDLENLREHGIERDRRIVSHFGKELITPYLSKGFLDFILSFDPAERRGAGRKGLLRKIAVESGLPKELAMKPKKAAQYGSGIMKILKKHREEILKQ